jgi:high affinity Mn2+ porin
MLSNRLVVGVAAEVSAPSFQNLNGLSIGGTSAFVSPTLGQESLSETVVDMGTVRGRIGYAPGDWLLYAMGGLAWTYDRLRLTQANGTNDMPFVWRFGWVAGAGCASSWCGEQKQYILSNGRRGAANRPWQRK